MAGRNSLEYFPSREEYERVQNRVELRTVIEPRNYTHTMQALTLPYAYDKAEED